MIEEKKKPYDIIYSLGTDCACASYLAANNLRSTAGPFDWLTNASLDTRLNLILDDFNNFMIFEDIISLPKDPDVLNDRNHDYYQNVRNGFYYYHDFPANIDIKDSFNSVKEKYDRRIKRFYQKIVTSRRVLLVWLAHNQIIDDFITKELCQKIAAKFNKEIDFLFIEHDGSKADNEIEKTEISSCIIKYKMETASFDISKNQTMGNIANCNKIFIQYELYLPWYKKNFLSIKNTFVKFICLFVPVKSWRRTLRSLGSN